MLASRHDAAERLQACVPPTCMSASLSRKRVGISPATSMPLPAAGVVQRKSTGARGSADSCSRKWLSAQRSDSTLQGEGQVWAG